MSSLFNPRGWRDDFVAGTSGWSFKFGTGTLSSPTVEGGTVLQAQMTQTAQDFVVATGRMVTDGRIRVRARQSSLNGQRRSWGIAGRVNGTSSNRQAYLARVDDGFLRLVLHTSGGSNVVLAEAAFTNSPLSWYWVDFYLEGVNLYAKAWASGSAEPEGWMVSASDATYASGEVGIFTGHQAETFQLDLFNTTVPDFATSVAEELEIDAMMGQSNIVARAPIADLPAYLSGALADIYLWNGNAWTNLEALVNSNYPSAGNDWGAEMLYGYRKRQATGKPVYIFKFAVSGSPLVTTSGATWNPAVSGSHKDNALSELAEARAALTAATSKATKIASILWVQGEADNAETQSAYANAQQALFTAFRNAAGWNVPIGDVLLRSTSAYASSGVNAAKTQVQTALGNIKLIRSNAFGDIGDNVHYNAIAQLGLGRLHLDFVRSITRPLPSGFPAPVFWLDMQKQENTTIVGGGSSGLMKVSQVSDVSGNNRHFTQGTDASRPLLKDGNVEKGMTGLESFAGAFMTGAVNPIAANGAYTMVFVVTDFASVGAGANNVVGLGGANGGLLSYAAGSSMARLRHASGAIPITATVATPATDTHIVLAAYAGAAGNYIRIDGVAAGSSVTASNHSSTAAMVLFEFNGANRNVVGKFSFLGLFSGALTTAQAELIEGYVAHILNIALPVGHPYAISPPT